VLNAKREIFTINPLTCLRCDGAILATFTHPKAWQCSQPVNQRCGSKMGSGGTESLHKAFINESKLNRVGQSGMIWGILST